MEYLKQTVAKNNVWFSKNMFMSGPKFLVNFLKFAKEREKSLVCASNEANLEFLLQITGIIHMTFWINLAKSELRVKIMVAPLYKIRSPPDPSFDLSRDLNHAPSFSIRGHLV